MSIVKRNSYSPASSTKSDIGTGMLVAGLGGTGLVVLAGLLPFISFPMLLVLLVVGGVAMKVL